MSYQIIDDAEVTEPITLAEAKAYMMIDTDYSSNDADINLLITSARLLVENHLNVGLAKREVLVVWNGCALELPLMPNAEIVSVFKNDEPDALPNTDYTVNGYNKKTIGINSIGNGNFDYFYRLDGFVEITAPNGFSNTDYYKVNYVTGYEVLPALLKQSLLAQIDFMYKNRGLPNGNLISVCALKLANMYSNNLVI
jgi:hypothetical protein